MKCDPWEEPPLTWVDDLLAMVVVFIAIGILCLGGFALLLVVGVIGKLLGFWQ